jgi:pyruvate, water dikinase
MSELIMSSLAVDRRGLMVAKKFDICYPAVLKLVKMIMDKCK